MSRRLLLVGVAVVLATAGVLAGTALEISQPVQAQISISGIGNSPTFNLIDNPASGTAGGKAGHIAGDDSYVIDFEGLKFGRAQTITVGNASDPVFTIENKYAQRLIVRLEAPAGAHVVEDPGSNGFFVNIKGPGGYEWPSYLRVWVQSYGRVGAVGAVAVPAGASYSYYVVYEPYGGSHPKAQAYHIPLKLKATNNDADLSLWAQKNLPANDVLFDPAGGYAYWKKADGNVAVIPLDQFDEGAWLEAWMGEQPE